MELLALFCLGMIGFLLGNLLFARVGVWIATIYEIAKDQGGDAKGARLASATFLSDGLWFLIATVTFVSYLHSESWATPILYGAVIAIAVFSLITGYYWRKYGTRRKDAA